MQSLQQRQQKLSELKTQANLLSGDADPYQVDLGVGLEELEALIESLDGEIKDIEDQVHSVATGVNESDYIVDNDVPVDLQSEVEQLFKPMIALLKSATEDSRQIEGLRNELSDVNRQREMANIAINSLTSIPRIRRRLGPCRAAQRTL